MNTGSVNREQDGSMVKGACCHLKASLQVKSKGSMSHVVDVVLQQLTATITYSA